MSGHCHFHLRCLFKMIVGDEVIQYGNILISTEALILVIMQLLNSRLVHFDVKDSSEQTKRPFGSFCVLKPLLDNELVLYGIRGLAE